MDRHFVYPRDKVSAGEWIMERRVLIACVLGILCFVVGFMAAGPRLHAGNRVKYAPPAIGVQPAASKPSSAANEMRPEITLEPLSDFEQVSTRSSSKADSQRSEDREPARPRRKKRAKPKPKPALESSEPVVVYEPPAEKPEQESGQEPVPIYEPNP